MGSETRFLWKFSGQCYMFFAFFYGVLDRIVFTLAWFESSLHSAQAGEQSCPRPLKLLTSQAVEGMLIRTGVYGHLRGE